MGQGSIAVLYLRSLHIIRAAYPWLEATHEELHKPMDLVSLRGVLVQQTSVEAAAAGGALVQTFYDLLASLIGPALTEQLPRAVWETFLGGPPRAGLLAMTTVTINRLATGVPGLDEVLGGGLPEFAFTL